jgi:hypothetical protein
MPIGISNKEENQKKQVADIINFLNDFLKADELDLWAILDSNIVSGR